MLLKDIYLLASLHPKKATTLGGVVLSGMIGAGYTIPDWVVPILLRVSEISLSVAEALQRVQGAQ